MKRKNMARNALFTSIISLLLCVSMLVGTTFAWFTDSVTSGNNVIASGNLDVEMYWADGKEDPETVTWQDASTGAIFNYNLWEPGYTEVRHIKIANEGSLELKYQLMIQPTGEVSELAEVIDVYYSDPAVQIADRAALAGKQPMGTLDTILNSLPGTASGKLAVGESVVITLALKMQESAGNAYQNLSIGTDFAVKLFATQVEAENDSFGNDYDKDAIIAATPDEAQAALDNAGPGATIQLVSGVDYGTLLLRPVEGAANTTTDVDMLVYRNEMLRTVKNLTIVGAPGAKVDAIEALAGHIEGSTGYVVDIQNLVIDSVEFTDKHTNASHSYAAPVFFDLSYVNVNGLTVKDCKLIGNNDKMNFVYIYTSGKVAFDNVAKNITITGNTVDGIARLCELRQTENVTITNNTIKNTALHGMLLPVSGGTYSGNVTITGNTAVGLNERFVRMDGAGDANVVIKNNTIIDHFGKDEDFIKVTIVTNTPVIENNNITRAKKVSDATELSNAIAAGGNVVLTENMTATAPLQVNGGTLNGNGNTLDFTGVKTSSWPSAYAVTLNNGGSKVENLTITNAGYAIGSTAATEDIYIDNVTTDYVTFAINGNGNNTNSVYVTNSHINGWISYSNIKLLSFGNCTLGKGNTGYAYLVVYGDTTFTGCTFESPFAMCARYQDGAVVAAGKTVTFTNCTYVQADGTSVKVTAENFASLFGKADDDDFQYMKQVNVVIDGVAVSWN